MLGFNHNQFNMEEGMFIKGVLILKPLDRNSITAGTMGVVDSAAGLDIVTVEHITQEGYWWVDGTVVTGELSAETSLNKIVVLSGEKTYPLKFIHWKKVIKNNLLEDRGVYTFEILPLKFRKGKYSRECIECHAWFTAAKSQHTCQECCHENSYALLKDTVSNKTAMKNFKLEEVKKIAVQSYELGKIGYSMVKYDDWLNKIIKNYGTDRD
jgi:hypothetical protein